MAFIYLCGIIAFIIQMIILHNRKRHLLHFLALVAMELFPACIAAHAFSTKQPSGVLGWKFNVMISGWIAGAILIGCLLAWVIYLVHSKGADDERNG